MASTLGAQSSPRPRQEATATTTTMMTTAMAMMRDQNHNRDQNQSHKRSQNNGYIVTITAGDHDFDNNNQPRATKRPPLTHFIYYTQYITCLSQAEDILLHELGNRIGLRSLRSLTLVSRSHCPKTKKRLVSSIAIYSDHREGMV